MNNFFCNYTIQKSEQTSSTENNVDMGEFFCNHKTQKSDPEYIFSEIDVNYRRDYSKGKSFKVSIWNEVDTYNNDDFIQDFVIYNQSLWARIDRTPSTNEVPTEGPWAKVMDGVSDVQFKEDGNKIFWKYEDESEWKDLFELDVVSESEIKNMLKDIATDVDSNFYDKTLSETSVNAVQNKVITQALNKKADKTELSKKQDVISDLSEIRNKANSALQSVPSEYVTESELANKGYLTEHQDISGKQDKIADLAQIRTNAQKGATALQTVPSEYATKTDVSKEVAKIVNSAPKAFDTLKEIADWIEEDAEPAIVLANKVEQKVDKIEGLGLSEENYTTEEKEKLAGLGNYDDTEIKQELTELAEKMGNISPTPMVSVTYAELVELRNNEELIAGMQYRITDFVTTTVQENTQSAGHQFDIIVTADDEKTLNEVARAIQHKFDIENYKDAYNLASDVKMLYIGIINHEGKEYHLYEAENHMIQMLVDFNAKQEQSIDPDLDYKFISLPAYTRWNNEGQWGVWCDGAGEGESICFKHDPYIATYFNDSNLAAWQIWYCLNNDKERFAWADDGINLHKAEFVAMFWNDPVNGINYNSHIRNDKIYDWGTLYDPETEMDNIVIYKSDANIYKAEGSADYSDQYFYRGIVEVDGEEYDSWKKFEVDEGDWITNGDGQCQYALTKRMVFDGEVIWPELESKPGKGVIYNMIDEYGNECPYDFKNIKFYYSGLGTDVYTFTWIDESYNVMDTSVFGNNGTLTCYGEIRGVYGNVIKPYMQLMYDEDSGDYIGTKQSLNNITFISDHEYDGVGNEGFYGCINNSFGNGCRNNSFGNNCINNSFGNDCDNNSFGNYCYNNSFKNYCYNNSFVNDCYNNSFGNNCCHNSFGNGCSNNSFGNGCRNNSFGNDCDNNSFGNYCYNNSFKNYCSNNFFVNDCDNNSFGNDCGDNSFGNGCYDNLFGTGCYSNSFGNGCINNSFVNDCSRNSFGNACCYNSFRLRASKTGTLLNYCQYNHFDDDCSYNVIWNSVQPTSSNKLQNINVIRGVKGTSSAYNFINIVDKNSAHEIKVAKNSNGDIKVYCEADLIQ